MFTLYWQRYIKMNIKSFLFSGSGLCLPLTARGYLSTIELGVKLVAPILLPLFNSRRFTSRHVLFEVTLIVLDIFSQSCKLNKISIIAESIPKWIECYSENLDLCWFYSVDFIKIKNNCFIWKKCLLTVVNILFSKS